MGRKILINQIRTPDGTVLVSRHVHDYVTYTDKNGQFYMVDGGTEYLRRGYDVPDFEELSVYEGDEINFSDFRTKVCRGGRGKNGDQPLTWVPLSEMNDNWLENVITYEEERRPNNAHLKYYRQEIEYRKENNISISEE